MRYYPAYLCLEGRKCVVIGGGRIAERKVRSLARAKACVWVVSPAITKGLSRLKKNKKISFVKSDYQREFLKGAFLVIAATDDRAVNARVSFDCHKSGILVNIADSASLSSFIAPAVLTMQDLIISISTSGYAPCLSKKIKEDLKKIIIPRYVKLLKLLKSKRRELKLTSFSARTRKSVLTLLSNSET